LVLSFPRHNLHQAGRLWALDRQTFRSILLKSTKAKRELYEGFLNSCPLLADLDPYERAQVREDSGISARRSLLLPPLTATRSSHPHPHPHPLPPPLTFRLPMLSSRQSMRMASSCFDRVMLGTGKQCICMQFGCLCNLISAIHIGLSCAICNGRKISLLASSNT
jgi:hypothetical protein